MRKISTILGTLFFFILLTSPACAAGLSPETLPLRELEGRYYFLSSNLHADLGNNKISSVNYQVRGDLIPWGTEVRIIRVTSRYLVFEDVANQRRYSYNFYWKTRSTVPLIDHIKRVFVKNIDDLKKQIETMSSIDKDGIYDGRVKPGMSREGVLVAIGYPPEFANREELLSDREWLYWINRFERMVVGFGRDGLVNRITGNY